MSKPNR